MVSRTPSSLHSALFSLHLYKYAFSGLAFISLMLVTFSYSPFNLVIEDVLANGSVVDVAGYREESQFEKTKSGYVLDCSVSEPRLFELCGLKFKYTGADNTLSLPSYANLDEVEVDAFIESDNPGAQHRAGVTFISLRDDVEYDENDLSTKRFQSVYFLPDDGVQLINRDRIVVDAWWEKLYQVPYDIAASDLSAVASILVSVETLNQLDPGRYKLYLNSLLLKRHIITPASVNLFLALIWPAVMLVFLCHFVVVKRVEMQKLQLLADRDPDSGFINLNGLKRLYPGKLNRPLTIVNIRVRNYLALQREFSKETVTSLIKATFGPFTQDKHREAFLVRKQDENILLVLKDFDEAFFGNLISASQKGVNIPSLGHLRLDVKLGIARGERGMTVDELLAQTTIAIDAIMDNEPGYKIYQPELKKEYRQARFVEQELRIALANKAFHLVFMPVYDSEENRIAGAEVLLRTSHLPLKSFSPEVYIRVAEKAGLIREIDFWVLEQAILALQKIQQPDFVLSVNISSKELMDTRFAEELSRLIDQYHVRPGSLCLEVTETFFIDVNTICFESIQAIRNLGVKLSLDDFGTGHASLQHLLNMPVNEIKIDRSFVWTLESEKSAVIVDAIVSIARICQYDVVAEGVETAEQLDKLIALGCRYFQGYLIAKPDSLDALLRFCHEVRHSPAMIQKIRATG